MSNPTNPFSWQMPTPTDLVTDLPADFEVFGQAVATSLADLLGGTTGQILSKNSNTDMDFVWTSPNPGDITGVTAGTGISGGGTSGDVTITNSMATEITAAGDMIIGTGSGTFDNLPIGTTGQVLTADTTVSPYKVKWASSAAAATSYSLLNTGGTTLSGASTVTISSLSGYNKFHILVKDAVSSSYSNYTMRFNADTSGIYSTYGGVGYGTASYSSNVFRNQSETNATSAFWGKPSGDNTSTVNAAIRIDGANSSGIKVLEINSGGNAPSNDGNQMINSGGTYTGSSVISSISFICGGTWSSGTVYVYGAN